MPLYEYRCRDCGHRFEVLQRLGDGADGLVCPRCDGRELEKQFSTFASGGERTAGPACGPSGST
jgi:putative FmdB family regulatory protein